jgi:hypothetical protein
MYRISAIVFDVRDTVSHCNVSHKLLFTHDFTLPIHNKQPSQTSSTPLYTDTAQLWSVKNHSKTRVEAKSKAASSASTSSMEFLSQMWSLLGLLTILKNVLPTQLLSLLHSVWQSLQDSITPYSYFDVPEYLGSAAVEPNALYRHAQLYLQRYFLLASPPPPSLTLSLPRSAAVSGGPGSTVAAPPSVSLSPNHSVADAFNGHRAVWTHHADTLQDSLEERRSFSLRLPKRHAAALLPAYLAHLAAAADNLERASRARRLHTNAASARGVCVGAVLPPGDLRHAGAGPRAQVAPLL